MRLLKSIKAIMDKKLAEDIVVIDFREESVFFDYFIVGSAKNCRMAHSIIEAIEEEVLKIDGKIRTIEGNKESLWQLVDCYDVVAHIFVGEEREVYHLEKLWADLPRIEEVK
ncbi:MAG: ribosome silencing factor [Anaerorhabdus sp.]